MNVIKIKKIHIHTFTANCQEHTNHKEFSEEETSPSQRKTTGSFETSELNNVSVPRITSELSHES